MVKHTYEARAPDGQIFTRSTAREYSHVIIAKHADWYWNGFRKTYEEKNGRKEGNVFFPAVWAGTPELAIKVLRSQQTMYMRDGPNKGKLMNKEVQLIPCHLKIKK